MKPEIKLNHEEIKAKALEIITRKGCAHEGEILDAIFPPPAFPGAQASELEKEAWNEARRGWVSLAYGGDGVEYRDSYASACSGATIALTKEGKIEEHNNGYASYSFTLKKSA